MYKLKIKKYRLLKNMTQKELARKINISQNYLSELENNKYDIKLSTLYLIHKKLDVCVFELIDCDECEFCKKRNL